MHLIDFEGFGFAGGKRVTSLRVFNMHKQVTTLLSQVRPDLPLFLFGHSMGCLVLNSFLCLNPDIAERLAGVMYSAPFYGLPDYKHIDPVKMEVLKILSLAIDEFVINAEIPLHKVTRNRNHHMSVLQTTKGAPLCSLGFLVSVLRMQGLVNAKAKSITYPYLMLLGEKDIIVNN